MRKDLESHERAGLKIICQENYTIDKSRQWSHLLARKETMASWKTNFDLKGGRDLPPLRTFKRVPLQKRKRKKQEHIFRGRKKCETHKKKKKKRRVNQAHQKMRRSTKTPGKHFVLRRTYKRGCFSGRARHFKKNLSGKALTSSVREKRGGVLWKETLLEKNT